MEIITDSLTTQITEIATSITETATETAAETGAANTWGGLFLIILLGIIIIIWAISKLIESPNKKNISSNTNEITVIPETGSNTNADRDYEDYYEYDGYDEDEEELIAVITAAISAVLKKPVSGFRVVSFKKRGNWR